MSTESTGRPVDVAVDVEGDNSRTVRNQIADLEFMRGLIAALDESGIDSLEISRGGTRIRISKSPIRSATVATQPNPGYAVPHPGSMESAAPGVSAQRPEAAAAPPAAPVSKLLDITSPMVGTFYRAPAPEAPSYVEVGSRIIKGQTLCVLEAMKLMNELEAEVQGIVREICVENSEPVEFGQVLFRIEPEA